MTAFCLVTARNERFPNAAKVVCIPLPPYCSFRLSSQMATTRIAPLSTTCRYGETPSRFMQLDISVMRSTPSTVRSTLPLPPLSVVPPTTTERIALVSYPLPMIFEHECSAVADLVWFSSFLSLITLEFRKLNFFIFGVEFYVFESRLCIVLIGTPKIGQPLIDSRL